MSSLIKKYWRPLNLYKRDRDFYARHAAGPVSSRDIIEIEYGGAMPRGWNVKDKAHQHAPVNITTPLTDSDASWLARIIMTFLTLGYVRKDANPARDIVSLPYPGKPKLALNKLIFSPLGQAGILHLAKTVVITAAPFVAALSPVGLMARYPIMTLWLFSSLRNQPLTQLFTLPFRAAMDTIGHENIHVLQGRDPYETKTGYNIFRNSFRERFNNAAQGSSIRPIDSLVSLGLASYFRNDFEIQARMNTLLTHKYAQWGRMPETRHEIWAALIDAGLRAPASIHSQLAASTEDISAFRKSSTIGRIGQQLTAPHIAELNAAYWGLYSAESREHYWHKALPYIYGHLTELCGDEDGLAKMGYSGPVTAGGMPVPLAPADREAFWNSIPRDEHFHARATIIKETEAARGLRLRDHFNDTALGREMAAIERLITAPAISRHRAPQ